MSHRCHAHGCTQEVPPKMLFCKPHWFATRKSLQRAIWNEYRPGQELRKNPTHRYLAIQQLCVSELAFRPKGNRAVAIECGQRAEMFRQRAIAEGAGDPFEQLSRRRASSRSQLELPGLLGEKKTACGSRLVAPMVEPLALPGLLSANDGKEDGRMRSGSEPQAASRKPISLSEPQAASREPISSGVAK